MTDNHTEQGKAFSGTSSNITNWPVCSRGESDSVSNVLSIIMFQLFMSFLFLIISVDIRYLLKCFDVDFNCLSVKLFHRFPFLSLGYCWGSCQQSYQLCRFSLSGDESCSLLVHLPGILLIRSGCIYTHTFFYQRNHFFIGTVILCYKFNAFLPAPQI